MITVIPCFNYTDLLAVTLPKWREILPGEIRILTHPADKATIKLGLVNDCTIITTLAWQQNGILNKASALDCAFGFANVEGSRFDTLEIGIPTTPGDLHPCDREWCLSLDADIYPMPGSPSFDVVLKTLENYQADNPPALYSIPRYQCDSPLRLQRHLEGALPLKHLKKPEFNSRYRNKAALCGYFQLWLHRLEFPRQFGSYYDARQYDIDFAIKFPTRENLSISVLYGLHIDNQRVNWQGRVSPQWGTRK